MMKATRGRLFSPLCIGAGTIISKPVHDEKSVECRYCYRRIKPRRHPSGKFYALPPHRIEGRT
jgi:hypothetical protein